MSELYPLMMMSEDRYCEKQKFPPGSGTVVCECEETKSDSLLKIMLLTGGSFLGNSPQQNLFFLLFNDDEGCDCRREDDGAMESCTENEIKGSLVKVYGRNLFNFRHRPYDDVLHDVRHPYPSPTAACFRPPIKRIRCQAASYEPNVWSPTGT